MAVLVFAEQVDGGYKKAAFEAVNYGKKVASDRGTECFVVTAGSGDPSGLGKYGADRILVDENENLKHLDPNAYTKLITAAAEKAEAKVIVFSNTSSGKALASRVAVKMEAGLVTGAVALPEDSDGFTVKKALFSGKAFAFVKINTENKVLALNPNSLRVEEMAGDGAIEKFSAGIQDGDVQTKVKERKMAEGDLPLEEAELVVSGGRGLKGPENWGMIEDLAKALGAATACSRPVADSGWRPHHEHVGQTGGTIRPNLYLAIGISGAIQHLAGVNQSKTIVVINKDPEAPFFKAADYGIVGDAFEVVPKLTEAVKEFKAKNN